MKIVIFDGTFLTTSFIRRLVKGLVKKHKVYILGFNLEIDTKIDGVKYVSLGSNKSTIKFFLFSLFNAIKLNKLNAFIMKVIESDRRSSLQKMNAEYIIKQIKPDIIHLQWLSNISVFEDLIEESHLNFVLSQRGYHLNVRPFVDKENFEYLQYWYPKIKGFHSVSNAIKNLSNKIYNSEKKIDKVVYSGFNLSKLEFKLNRNNNRIEILSVGRMQWIKGYNYAIKAMKLLHNNGIDFTYTIVGLKPSEELLYLINDFELSSKIFFKDKLTQAEVYNEMASSDIFLLPSIEEGIANVCIEAMALGLTVLSTDCGGMEELINHNKNGFIVPKRNPKKIAEKIIEFSKMDSKEIEKIKYSARKKVEEQHNQSKMISDMEELYVSVYERN